MVPVLSAGWNIFLIAAVLVCVVIVVINVRKETQARKKARQDASPAPADPLDNYSKTT